MVVRLTYFFFGGGAPMHYNQGMVFEVGSRESPTHWLFRCNSKDLSQNEATVLIWFRIAHLHRLTIHMYTFGAAQCF